jgi:uncharacterized protein YecT (DUF1311 family)
MEDAMPKRHLPLIALVLPFGTAVLPPAAHAASFDCGAAATPFEEAICGSDDLSRADEVMAKAFATSTGGLTEENVTLMRSEQRAWLDYARRACTDNAEPLERGSYDDVGIECLLQVFNDRTDALEESRMTGRHRFLVKSLYWALPDPEEADNPDSYWKVARHELSFALLDADDPMAERFNAFMMAEADSRSDLLALDGGETPDAEPSSDVSTTMVVKDVAGDKRITLEETSYWYGHGAAHGQSTISFLHYLPEEDRVLEASDIFTGKGWEKRLRSEAWTQLQSQHAEWLQIENPDDIADIVTNPVRWDLDDDYGLVIQFEPYEVAAYAYGAPTITIPWDKLSDFAAENQQAILYGF